MQISGLEKLTLIDYPGQLAATIFLFGCNFKCGFCHNPELVLPEKARDPISQEKVLQFLKKRKKYLDGVCITGGEPLINKGLPKFLKKVKEMGYLVKIDTNGTNPELLKELIDKGLVDYVAMDIKADKENYDLLAGTEVEIPKIEEAIKLVINSEVDYKFRTTAIKGYHTKGVMENIGEWLKKLNDGKKTKKFAIQNFIPREGRLIDDKFEEVKELREKELEELKEVVKAYFEEVEVRM